MKKFFYSLAIILLSTGYIFAQDWGEGILSIPARIWTDPVIYNYNEEVTWYFDLSAEDAAVKEVLDDATLALWTWQPTNPGDGHIGGGYGLPQEELQLVHRGGYVYSITMKPSELYAKSDIEASTKSQDFVMHIRVFSADGMSNINCEAFKIRYPHILVNDVKSYDILSTIYPPVKEGEEIPRINATTSLAIMLNNAKLKAEFTSDLFVNASLNDNEYAVNYDPANPDLTKAQNFFGIDDVYVFNIKDPSDYFGVPYDYQIDSIRYEFRTANSEEPIYTSVQKFTPVKPWKPTITTGINEVASISGSVKMYLSQGTLTVNAPQFEIYSISGALVATSKTSVLDISHLSDGIYILKAPNGALKFVK